MTPSTRQPIKPDHRVLIRRCEEYDEETIQGIIKQGMKDLGYKPSGKVFMKPNVVYATKNGKYGSTAPRHIRTPAW
jgi:hypothetical protein